MRISPEPLHPLRSWRELWQPEPISYERAYRDQTTADTGHWKQTKRGHFRWIGHLFNRQTHK